MRKAYAASEYLMVANILNAARGIEPYSGYGGFSGGKEKNTENCSFFCVPDMSLWTTEGGL